MNNKFDLNKITPKHSQNLAVYSSGKSEFSGKAEIFLDTNESPFDLFSEINLSKEEYQKLFSGQNRYPDPLQLDLKKDLAEFYNSVLFKDSDGNSDENKVLNSKIVSKWKDKPSSTKLQNHISSNQIFLSNGSDEAIGFLIQAFCEPFQDQIIISSPTFGMYQVSGKINRIEVIDIPLIPEKWQLDTRKILDSTNSKTKILFICSPNNPTGNLLNFKDIEILLENFPGIVVIDQAYIEFCQKSSWLFKLNKYPNLVIMQTFSKAWSLAGLRAGITFADSKIIEILNKFKAPYNISGLNQKILKLALQNSDLIQKNLEIIQKNKQDFYSKLKQIPAIKKIYPSDSNFFLIKILEANQVYQKLLKNGIVVRNFSQKIGLENCLRITIGSSEENDRLINELTIIYNLLIINN